MIKIWREVTYREKQVTCNQYCDWKRNIYRTLPCLIKKELRIDAPNSWLEVPFSFNYNSFCHIARFMLK